MFESVRSFSTPLLLAMLVAVHAGSGAAAQDGAWRVSRLSGDVSITASNGKQAPLAEGAVLNLGDNIQTGRNGRVLLVRGDENIMVSPNSVIGIPKDKKSGLSTTIVQQAGSILLEVEKRNVKHFSVETPYLAAVVKGTQFRVTVNPNGANVDVLRGKVEVTDFKSGQYAMVLPGQAANVSAQGSAGLSLSGSGTLSPVERGAPRGPLVSALPEPKDSLPAQNATSNAQQGRVAMSTGVERSVAATSGGNAARKVESFWSSIVDSVGKGLTGGMGQGSRKDEITVYLVFAFGVGGIVTLFVSAFRFWRSRRDGQKPA